MSETNRQTLPCSCQVEAARDFLGRVVGTIVVRGDQCPRQEHVVGHVLVMPGRANARPD